MQLIQKLNQEVKLGKHFNIWPHIISTSFGSICGKNFKLKFIIKNKVLNNFT